MAGPSRVEATTTGLAAILFAAALLIPALGSVLWGLGFVLLEVVGRVVDRPTWLVVSAYLLIAALSLALEFRQPHRGRVQPVLWIFVSALAVLGQAYVLVLAWRLRPFALLALVLVAAGLWLVAARRGSDSAKIPGGVPSGPLPVVSLFVAVHLLVEGAAGHILTPWLHEVSAAFSRLSVAAGWAYTGLCGVAALLLAVVWWRNLTSRPLFGWLHADPRRLTAVLAPLSLLALFVVSGHYLQTMWNCTAAWPDGVVQLSDADGTFDLTTTADERFLVVSRREPQEILILALQAGGTERRLSTRTAGDTLLDRSEPETLLSYGSGSDVLVLLGSSDSEQGNRVARLDAETGTLHPLRSSLGEGVSDLVRDEQGGVWLSTEMEGRVIQLDPARLSAVSEIRVGANDDGDVVETNKILVDREGGKLWSVGLWSDANVRLTDLNVGAQRAEQRLGTHQWDMGMDRNARRIYVPRLVEGAVHVLDADTLESLDRWPLGFGIRPIELAEQSGLVVVGNLYAAVVSGHDRSDGQERFRHRIGGHIKGLHVSASGRIFSGSNCGVFELMP